jgi:hypothetical protein
MERISVTCVACCIVHSPGCEVIGGNYSRFMLT